MAQKYLENTVTGSPSLQTSTAKAEILTAPQVNGFTFINYADCHVSTDFGLSWMFLKAKQGLIFAPEQEIHSFRIQEANVQYQWTGFVVNKKVTI